ncbi:MAG: hypothetical protein ACOC8H_01235 [bacterium]
MASFSRYVGVDYSGAETDLARLRGLQVYEAGQERQPVRVNTPAGEGWKWNRKEVAQWLVEQMLSERSGGPVIVGIDHGFSFPVPYLDRYELADWDAFLDDFCRYWHNKEEVYVDAYRENNPRTGTTADGLRLTEKWTASAKCLFQFAGQGTVAKSTHAGIPWLRFLRRHPDLQGHVHFWPFDGFDVRVGASVVAEVYPAIFHRRYEQEVASTHERDAYSVARWLRESDARGILEHYLSPPLTTREQKLAKREGWILGVA